MKRLRSIFGLLMIGALLALMFHQHDCDEGVGSHEQCPAAAWHAGAVQAAALPVTAPTAPQFAVTVALTTFSTASEAEPQSFLPRGPPTVPAI